MKKIVKSFIVIALILFSFFTYFNVVLVHAEVSNYSDVLDDLSKDDTFDVNNYPSVVDDYSLKLIQIAESIDNELFLYVYQPSHYTIDLLGTSVKLSNEYSKDGVIKNPKIYDIELVSTSGVFDKYLVKNYQVSNEVYRYYNIVSIYRVFNKTIDKPFEGGIRSEIDYGIGQQWSCYYLNDKLIYEMNTFDLVELTPTMNGNIYFGTGFKLGNLLGSFQKCNLHFLAFNIEDYIATRIFDADMVYKIRKCARVSGLGGSTTNDPWSDNIYVTLRANDDPVIFNGGGLFAKTFTWNRISSASAFIKNFEDQGGNLTKGAKDTLEKSQWVFAYLETEQTIIAGGSTTVISYYETSDVTILRLHFQTINGTYNLGTVMDKTTADNIPDGSASGVDVDAIEDLLKKVAMLIGVIALLVILGFCTPILNILINVIFIIFKFIFKGFVFVVSLPFKLFNKLFNKNKKP